MNITEELSKLYNTMLTIETKGSHTKTMADCLRFTEQLIIGLQNQANEVKNDSVEQ